MYVDLSACVDAFTDVSHSQYYTRALASPLGQHVRSFYTTTSKQILDIHEEARRISNEHKAVQHAHSTGRDDAGISGGAHSSSKEA